MTHASIFTIRLYWDEASTSWTNSEILSGWRMLFRDLRRKPDRVEVTWERRD